MKERDYVILESVIKKKRTFGHNRHVIEALEKQKLISSYKYNPKAIKRNTLNFMFNHEMEKLNFVYTNYLQKPIFTNMAFSDESMF